MKINLIFITIIFLCLSAACSKSPKRPHEYVESILNGLILERSEMGFKGKVRAVLTYEYAPEDWTKNKIRLDNSPYSLLNIDRQFQEIIDVEIIRNHAYLFDRFGRLIKDIGYENDFETQQYIAFENYIFNKRGKLMEWNHAEVNQEITHQKKWIYDDYQRLIEYVEDGLNDYVYKSLLSYINDTLIVQDLTIKNGDMIYQDIDRNPTDYFDSRERKEYDQNGKLIKTTYLAYGEEFPSYSIHYDYDYKGNKMQETYYDALQLVTQTKKYYYNNANTLIEEIKIDSIGTEIKRFTEAGYEYEYIWIPFSPQVHTFSGHRTYYDQYKNEIKRIDLERYQDGSFKENVKRIELGYDDTGNWISKKTFINDTLRTRTERQIVYY